jgi:excisionase family DNA binding protein
VRILKGKYQASGAYASYTDAMNKGILLSPTPAQWAVAAPDPMPTFHSAAAEKEEPERATAARTLLLTVDEVATTLQLGRTLIYDLLRRGDLASIKIGNRRRIPAAALDAFVARLLAEQKGGASA